MSIWRKQGGIIGKKDGGNVYPSSGSWDVTESYTDENLSPTVPPGEVLFSTVQSDYSWTVPTGVESVNIVCVSGGGGAGASTLSNNGVSGGGGGGGGLHWVNSVSVTAGETLLVTSGAGGTGGTAAGQNNSTDGADSFVKRAAASLSHVSGGGAGTYNVSNVNLVTAGGVPYYGSLGGGGGAGGQARGGAAGRAIRGSAGCCGIGGSGRRSRVAPAIRWNRLGPRRRGSSREPPLSRSASRNGSELLPFWAGAAFGSMAAGGMNASFSATRRGSAGTGAGAAGAAAL